MTELGEPRQITLAGRIFRSFSREHLPEMRLLFRGGKLSPKFGDWNNALNHGLVLSAGSRILSEGLGLSPIDSEKLFTHALVHDWNKRLEKRATDFNPDEELTARSLRGKLNLDDNLIAITHPEGQTKVLKGEATLLEKVLMYLDDIVDGEVVVTPEQRLEKTKSRYKDLDIEFWENQLKADKIIERELFELMKNNGILIKNAEDIPQWINSKLQEKYQ